MLLKTVTTDSYWGIDGRINHSVSGEITALVSGLRTLTISLESLVRDSDIFSGPTSHLIHLLIGEQNQGAL